MRYNLSDLVFNPGKILDLCPPKTTNRDSIFRALRSGCIILSNGVLARFNEEKVYKCSEEFTHSYNTLTTLSRYNSRVEAFGHVGQRSRPRNSPDVDWNEKVIALTTAYMDKSYNLISPSVGRHPTVHDIFFFM